MKMDCSPTTIEGLKDRGPGNVWFQKRDVKPDSIVFSLRKSVTENHSENRDYKKKLSRC